MQTRIAQEDGRLIIASSQDCTAIAEDAKRRHNEGHFGSSELKHAANIPTVIIQKYLNDKNITFREFAADKSHIRAVLNDPSLADFRIWKGAV